MRVDCLKVGTSDDQEDDRSDGGNASEAARTPLCSLEQTVADFQEAVGLARVRPCHDALQMRADHPGHVLHSGGCHATYRMKVVNQAAFLRVSASLS